MLNQPGEENLIAASALYFAAAVQGGGGPFVVEPLGSYRRFPAAPSVFQGHTSSITSLDFSPFSDSIIASGSEDSLIKVLSAAAHYRVIPSDDA